MYVMMSGYSSSKKGTQMLVLHTMLFVAHFALKHAAILRTVHALLYALM